MSSLNYILSKKDLEPLTQNECIYLIQEYVRIRKGVYIEPVLKVGIDLPIQIELMTKMAVYAFHWLKENYHE